MRTARTADYGWDMEESAFGIFRYGSAILEGGKGCTGTSSHDCWSSEDRSCTAEGTYLATECTNLRYPTFTDDRFSFTSASASQLKPNCPNTQPEKSNCSKTYWCGTGSVKCCFHNVRMKCYYTENILSRLK
jgi:hypothetical protein